MSDQLERVIRSLRHLWAQPDATIEQFATEAVAALRPELEDAERYRWLRDNEHHSISVERHENRCNYISVAEWIEQCPDLFEDCTQAQREEMAEKDVVWRLQWYPDTPIGFKWTARASLDAAIDAARQEGRPT
jgi:hypothetical protein